MSRVIKFRAWDGIRMIMPSDNSYYQHYVSFCGGIIQKSSEGMACFGGNDSWRVVESLKLMQFTGLHDVNGVEIYESDVVSMWYAPQAKCKGVISFTDGCFVFETNEAKPLNCPAHDCVNKRGNFFTVIGNVHQNPELLEPKP